MEIHLTHMEKLMAITIAAGVVLLAFILVVCSVGPGCWINNMLERRRRRMQAQKGLYSGVFTTLKKRENGYGSYPDGSGICMSGRPSMSGYSSVTHSMKSNVSSDGRDSTYSSLSESGRSSPAMLSQTGIPHDVIVEEEENQTSHDTALDPDKMLGQVLFSLRFLTSADSVKGQLVIGLQEATNLPPREYLGSGDPYFVIRIIKERRSLRRSKDTVLSECQSRVMRKTRNPVFAQTFTLDLNKDDLKDCRVELRAWDHDRLASPTLLGETSQALRDVRQLTSSMEPVSLSYYLSPGKQNFGEVMFGLSYLPTAQRLSFSIIKATNVKHAHVCSELDHFSPYIRVIMVSSMGKALKKKKTTVKKGIINPVFNENLIFNINNYPLDSLTFLVVMCHKITAEPPSDEDSLETNRDSSRDSIRFKDLYVGKIVLGKHVRGCSEKGHWMEMIKQPRRSISQAHTLK